LLLTDKNTFCVLADKLSLKVRNIISKGVYDVVHTNWLERCLNQQILLKWYITAFPSFSDDGLYLSTCNRFCVKMSTSMDVSFHYSCDLCITNSKILV